MNTKHSEASPMKAIFEEIETFRVLVRATLNGYAARLDTELAVVCSRLEGVDDGKKRIPTGKLGEMRDMLALLRNVDVKPEKGRRKDIKKFDSLVSDLSMLSEKW